ncbi:MAG: hypothetical protein BGO49_14775 [Planctomycetales bacterium 71-10]|nr:MAG: hypothetical protein BGO49_14775 [Planctomycetales bacterium 71-10]
MQFLIRPFVRRMFVDQGSLLRRWRAARMRECLRLASPPSGARIVDLGGSEFIWSLVDHDFHVTFVNLPGRARPPSDPARYARIEHDACDLRGILEDGSFDLAFSNSTIEHVGDEARQAAFAREVRRLAPAYWVQTPSDRFPIEIHTGVPFFFKLPEARRRRMIERWRPRYPDLSAMLDGTRVLGRGRMRELFPDGLIHVERKLGLEKSYSFYKPWRRGRA